MFHADLVTDRPHLLQGLGGKMELLSGVRVDGVDYEVGVEMLRVDVGGNKYLTAWKELFRQFQRNFVGFGRGDVLSRREGLNILVEEYSAGLAVQIFGGHEALLG